MSIPIYRAKKIISNEFISGNLIQIEDKFFISDNIFFEMTPDYEGYDFHNFILIDPSTLAIHFPKWRENVFASIESTGFGGTLFRWNRNGVPPNMTLVCVYVGYRAILCDTKTMNMLDLLIDAEELEIIGIHKG